MFRKAVFLAFLAVGCGARTSLNVEELEPVNDSAPLDTDLGDTVAPFDSGLPDTFIPEDAVVVETGCRTDAECEDGIACTADACDPTAGVCVHTPISARCDDGLFCTGDERCDAIRGCVTTPRNCSDPVSCTVDTCNEASKSCVRTPDDKLCPVSHGCDQMLGCQARAIAHTDTDLYEIRLPSGIVTKIGPTTGVLTDVALHPGGTLYGMRFDGFCILDLKTGGCSSPVTPLMGSPVGLDFAPDGRLYSAGGADVNVINLATGTQTRVAGYPPGMAASGDLAFVGMRMLGTARSTTTGGNDYLVEFDLATRTSRPLGRTNHRNIWGLAAYGPTLYGLTEAGQVLKIDPMTGASSVLSTVPGAKFWGATAR